MLEVMFDEINAQLESQNLKIRKGKIIIVDTMPVQSAARTLKKPKEEKTQEISVETGVQKEKRKLSLDSDTAFFKKGNSCVLGFKKNLATDEEGGKKFLFYR